jgi:hypothetical protein
MVETSDTIEAIEECYRMGWTDGLPVVPPADYRVRAMLDRAALKGGETLLELGMRRRRLTAENAAASAVMAGCLPDYFPVLVTAFRALGEETNVVHSVSASTSSPAPVLAINGPIRRQIGINCGHGLFGPGSRANASIGRAIRLSFINGFDARPGTLDRGTMGDVGKFSLCIGEDEEGSPWEPLHVERGYRREDSTVTVASGHSPVTVNSRHGTTAESILLSFADTMSCAALAAGWPCEWMLVVGPEHALTLTEEGFGKADIRQYLMEHTRRTVKDLKRMGVRQGSIQPGDESTMAPAARTPEDIIILAAGGSGGRYSSIMNLAMFRSKTRRIEMGVA